MSDKPSNNQNQSDEIDLGHFFALLGRGFMQIFKGLLRFFVFIKKSSIILLVLITAGVIIGFSLKLFIGEEHELDVIVDPKLETKNYLYDAIAQIQSNIDAKDKEFCEAIDIDPAKLDDFSIEVTPLKVKSGSGLDDEMKVLDLLKDFENSGAITDILRTELRDMTTKEHRITFFFKDPEIAESYAGKILDYINSNLFYSDLLKVQVGNAQNRIQRNDSLIAQIDMLINNYSKRMLKEQVTSEGRLILESQEPLDVPSLLSIKNQVIRDTELKKLELERMRDIITVVNFGKPHKVQKPIFQENAALIPSALVGLFFLVSLVRFLNLQAKKLKIE